MASRWPVTNRLVPRSCHGAQLAPPSAGVERRAFGLTSSGVAMMASRRFRRRQNRSYSRKHWPMFPCRRDGRRAGRPEAERHRSRWHCHAGRPSLSAHRFLQITVGRLASTRGSCGDGKSEYSTLPRRHHPDRGKRGIYRDRADAIRRPENGGPARRALARALAERAKAIIEQQASATTASITH